MGYKLRTGETPDDGLRRVIDEQAGRAIDALRRAADSPAENPGAPHEARKRFKKIRAALRLIRDRIGDKAYARENAAWRDAGRLIASAREAQAYLETADRLADGATGRAAELLDQTRAILETRFEAAQSALLGDSETLQGAIAAAETARERASELKTGKKGFKAFKKGLKRVYARGVERGEAAFASGDPEVFHDWRKRVKYLWLQLRILGLADPEDLDGAVESARMLADILGEDHDLAELRALLLSEPETFGDPDSLTPLLHLMDEASLMLRARARPLYEALYAEKPKAFLKQVEAAWDARRKAA